MRELWSNVQLYLNATHTIESCCQCAGQIAWAQKPNKAITHNLERSYRLMWGARIIRFTPVSRIVDNSEAAPNNKWTNIWILNKGSPIKDDVNSFGRVGAEMVLLVGFIAPIRNGLRNWLKRMWIFHFCWHQDQRTFTLICLQEWQSVISNNICLLVWNGK